MGASRLNPSKQAVTRRWTFFPILFLLRLVMYVERGRERKRTRFRMDRLRPCIWRREVKKRGEEYCIESELGSSSMNTTFCRDDYYLVTIAIFYGVLCYLVYHNSVWRE
ncbi:hypothetical protein K445DRAFT_173983 [Daldinia sp. EC12]|nr:hypothetical protein K445DRAFT_173983 [Daldinia sp. EC12]